MLAPNAIATVAAVVIIAITVKRISGPIAGLLAGALLTTTPILAAVARSNEPESFFLLGLSLVAFSATKAIGQKSLRHLIFAGVWVAVGFQTYMPGVLGGLARADRGLPLRA